jgi:hypothetical protein
MRLGVLLFLVAVFAFGCERSGDTDPPLVVGTRPVDGDIGVVSDTVVIYFSEAMNPTVTSQAVSLDTLHGFAEQPAFPYPDRMMFRVEPDSGTVTVHVAPTAEDEEGNRLGIAFPPFSFTFAQ